jgi:hypothetical protein
VKAGDAASQGRGKALLEKAQQAMGGPDKLAAVKDSTKAINLVMEPSAGGMTIKQNTRLVGNQVRVEEELPFGKISIYSDGKSGWMATPQGATALPAEILEQMRGESFRDLVGLVLSIRDTTRVVNAVDPNTVQIATSGGQNVKLAFDPATGLPATQTYQETGQNGAPSQTVEIFSDWRDVAGIKMPFKIVLQQDGKKAGEATAASYQFNSGLKAEDLAKKP